MSAPGRLCFGIWYCPSPSCMCKREFVTFDHNVKDPDLAECDHCGYVYGKAVDETQTDPNLQVKPRLDRGVVAAGLAEYKAKLAERRKVLGLPDKGLPDPIRREYQRRQGLV